MNQKPNTREIVVSGLLLAMGVLLPMVFHAMGAAGKIFLPMHVPVLVGGFLLSPGFAFVVGAVTPVLSGLLTGMPPMFPMAVIMAFELAAYGLVVSLARKRLSVIPSLIIAMLVGRLVAGITVAALVRLFSIKFAPPVLFVKGAIITGWPGIAIQLVLIPTLLYALKINNKTGRIGA